MQRVPAVTENAVEMALEQDDELPRRECDSRFILAELSPHSRKSKEPLFDAETRRRGGAEGFAEGDVP